MMIHHDPINPAFQIVLAEDGETTAAVGSVGRKHRWTVVLAFYNEADEIEATLRSLCRQTEPFRLILVDNGSTDGSAEICRRVMRVSAIEYIMLRQDVVAGQTAALSRGIDAVATELVATCDADTFYPSDYLRNAGALFDAGGAEVVVACAYYLRRHSGFGRMMMDAFHQVGIARVLPRQAHVGAAGQCFRTEALQQAGGYCHVRWPYLLGDHEIMHRVLKQGRQVMSLSHWCSPSDRRTLPMRWLLVERVIYHLVPFAAKDRYFRWLGRRFEKRGLFAARLRERSWKSVF